MPAPGNTFSVDIPHKDLLNRPYMTLRRPHRGYGEIDCEKLFNSLDVHRAVSLFLDVMQEKRIVIYSENLGKVAATARTIVALLYPFKWEASVPFLAQISFFYSLFP